MSSHLDNKLNIKENRKELMKKKKKDSERDIPKRSRNAVGITLIPFISY